MAKSFIVLQDPGTPESGNDGADTKWTCPCCSSTQGFTGCAAATVHSNRMLFIAFALLFPLVFGLHPTLATFGDSSLCVDNSSRVPCKIAWNPLPLGHSTILEEAAGAGDCYLTPHSLCWSSHCKVSRVPEMNLMALWIAFFEMKILAIKTPSCFHNNKILVGFCSTSWAANGVSAQSWDQEAITDWADR